MQSIIQQLFHGELTENENMIKQHSPQRQKRLTKLGELVNALEQTFSEDQRKLFEEFDMLNSEDWTEEVGIAYERGFKTGGLIAIEMHRV